MPRVRAEAELLRMLTPLCHETFYRTGTYIDEASGVYVGWTVRAGSFADGMPLQNGRGDVTLIFSGDDFQPSPVVRRLKPRGQGSAPNAPTYLVGLSEDSAAFPASLNGRFQGVLIDGQSRTAALFNDRFGLHRLYYHRSKDAFYFSAEAKSILAVRPDARSVDPQGLGEFISCGCVLENRTLFSGVRVMPPAALWTFQNGALTKQASYFDPREWEEQPGLTAEEYYRELRGVFSESLPQYCDPLDRIGISLTGGLDTRMIMAWRSFPPGSVPCYTFGGTFRENHDVRVARQVAAICGQPHQGLVTGDDFLRRFPRYAERAIWLADGCVDLSRSPDLYVNERAREIAPIRLTGNYGSEVLRGVRAFKPQTPAPDLYDAELLRSVGRARSTYDGLLDCHPVSFAVFRQAPWHHYGLLALEETQLSLRSPYLDNQFVRTVFRGPEASRRSNDVCLRLIAEGNPRLARIPTDRGLGGSTNRARRALRRGVLQAQFKAEYAYDYGMPQWLARIDRIVSPFGPERLFLGRHKSFHFRVWYRDALAPYVRDMLLDRRTLARPYLDARGVEAIVRGHVTGSRNHTTEIHKLLALELLHRLFVDAPIAETGRYTEPVLRARHHIASHSSRTVHPVHTAL